MNRKIVFLLVFLEAIYICTSLTFAKPPFGQPNNSARVGMEGGKFDAAALDLYLYEKLCPDSDKGLSSEECATRRGELAKYLPELGAFCGKQDYCTAVDVPEAPSTFLGRILNRFRGAGSKSKRSCGETPPSGPSCGTRIKCNIKRSLLSVFGSLVFYKTRDQIINYFTKNNEDAKACLGSSGKTDCLTEALFGFYTAYWGPVELGIGMTKSATKAVAKGAKSTYNYLANVEGRSRAALLNGSEAPPSMIRMFMKRPVEFMIDSGKAWVETAIDIVQKMYGCNKWEGTPHASECVEPMESWRCANCDQRMNLVCGAGSMVMMQATQPLVLPPVVQAFDIAENMLEYLLAFQNVSSQSKERFLARHLKRYEMGDTSKTCKQVLNRFKELKIPQELMQERLGQNGRTCQSGTKTYEGRGKKDITVYPEFDSEKDTRKSKSQVGM